MEKFLLDVIVPKTRVCIIFGSAGSRKIERSYNLVRKNNGKVFSSVLRLEFGVLFTEPLLT